MSDLEPESFGEAIVTAGVAILAGLFTAALAVGVWRVFGAIVGAGQ